MKKHGPPTILWDFDGTLAYHPTGWSTTLMQLLDENVPGHSGRIEQIRVHMHQGFPWHSPDAPHHELSTPEAWWSLVEDIFIKALDAVGVEHERAVVIARLAHRRIIDPRSYHLYEDTLEVLQRLADRGWSHIILSNHVPELAQIASALGLDRLVKRCISSAVVGYEKPHPEVFRIALAAAGDPADVWMVGDNPVADVAGAEALGLPAILVRSPRRDDVHYYAANLWEAACIIEAYSARSRGAASAP